MKGGHPTELGENCSWPTCKIKRDIQKVRRCNGNPKDNSRMWLRFLEIYYQNTAVGSPIRTPRKMARIGLDFNKASKPDLKSDRIISICIP